MISIETYTKRDCRNKLCVLFGYSPYCLVHGAKKNSSIDTSQCPQFHYIIHEAVELYRYQDIGLEICKKEFITQP